MKKYIAVLLSATILGAAACHTEKKIVYDFPPAMTASIRSGYTEMCEKGRLLYNKNCARCHNVTVKGKKVIPDFAQEKLVGYAIRVANRRHEESMPDSLVTVEDLGLIMTFLTWKPKLNTGTFR